MALDPKRLLLWEGEGAKILPPVVCGPSKLLPEAAWLVVFSEKPGGGDVAETDADVRALGLDPKILLLGAEVKVLVLLGNGSPKMPPGGA